jgi:hypothetical protein
MENILLRVVHAENSTQVVMGYPHHIIQRGHNMQVVFVSDEDYQNCLDNLCEWKEKLGCKVYAYCLMTNPSTWSEIPEKMAETLQDW